MLPRFLWDFTKPWNEPVWDDQQPIREKYGLVTPGLLTYRNCVPRMADLTDATAGVTMQVESGGLTIHATATLPRDVDALPLAVWRLPLEADACEVVAVSEGARFVPVVDGSTGNLHGIIVCDRVTAGTHTWTIRLRGKASAPVKPAFHIGSNVAGRSFLRASGETTAYVWLDGPGAPDGILTVTVAAGRAASVKYNDGTTAAAEEGVLRVRLDRDWRHESPMITGLTAAEIAARGVFRAGEYRSPLIR